MALVKFWSTRHYRLKIQIAISVVIVQLFNFFRPFVLEYNFLVTVTGKVLFVPKTTFACFLTLFSRTILVTIYDMYMGAGNLSFYKFPIITTTLVEAD